MDKISKVSRGIRLLLVVGMVLQVVFWAMFAVEVGSEIKMTSAEEGASFIMNMDFNGMESEAKQLVAAGMNPALWLSTPGTLFNVALYGLLFLLFGQFQRSQIFSEQAVVYISRIGLCLLLWPIVELIYGPSLLLSLKVIGVLEHGELTLGFGSDGLSMMAAGAMIMVIGWIMAEGNRLKDEQELTI